MISHINFMPTLIDIAGGKPSENLDGRSFKNVFNRQQTTFRDRIYVTHTRDGDMKRISAAMYKRPSI